MPTASKAQSGAYPNQRITFIVGFAAGGFADTIGRWVAARLGERTGQTVVVQNMEGGGGIRAARRVATAPADGYTILVTTTSLAINESLVPDRGYTANQFEAVSLPISAPESLSASTKSSIKTLADLVTEAKAGKVFMGSAGIGSGSHIAAEYFFKVLAKTPVKHIPFPGGAPAMVGLLTGDVTVLAATATGNISRAVNNGDIIGLGIAATERSPTLPSVPTFAEARLSRDVRGIVGRLLCSGRNAGSRIGEAQQRDQCDPAGAGHRQAYPDLRPANDGPQPRRIREAVQRRDQELVDDGASRRRAQAIRSRSPGWRC